MKKNARILVLGHRGMVGSAIIRNLAGNGYGNIVTSGDIDLRAYNTTGEFFESVKPEYVFLAAAKVGGIWANSQFPASFLGDNLQIQMNVIHHAARVEAKKLLFLGSSCIYPRLAPQPIREESLLTGPLEKTNEAYAIAKIAGVKLCQAYREEYGVNFISAMPTNLFGPGDNYDPKKSHVIPGLIYRFHDAKMKGEKTVKVWGTGTPLREFMYVDDLADACVFLMNNYDDAGPINVGTGEEISIRALALKISNVVGFTGKIEFDPDAPDGTPRKLLDCSKLHALGYRYKTTLTAGLWQTYQDYLKRLKR